MEDKIVALLEERFKEDDLKDCFVVEVKMGINKKVEIFIDSDSGVDFKKCQVVSRYLESHIDGEGWLGEKYVLEVSSPGVSRPLILKRQYHKHLGRKLEVKLLNGGKESGLLQKISEEGIVLQRKERIKEGKKKQTVVMDIPISFEEIKESIVKISFN